MTKARHTGSNHQIVFDGPFSFRALRGKTDKEAEANARLIAAAPDLLAACKLALKHLVNEKSADAVRIAIALAES